MKENSLAYKALTDRYPTGAVLRAAEITHKTLQNWFDRKLAVGSKGKQIGFKDPSTGRRQFSFEEVMAFAIVKNLSDLGLDLQNAFKAANQFSFIASDRHGCRRVPAFPFAGGDDDSLFDVDTLLAVNGDKFLLMPHRRGEGTLDAFLSNFPNGFILLKINPLFEVVAARLGYRPLHIIEGAYQGKPLMESGWV